MSLIKCKECGKEISDKASTCPNCGCPTEIKIKKNNILSNIWLIMCTFVCLLISGINFLKIFNIDGFNDITIGILALILAISYVMLLIKRTKKSFYLLLGINIIIFIYSFSFRFESIIFYIVCTLLNSLITFLVVKNQLKGDKFKIKNYLLVFILLLAIASLTIIFNVDIVNKNNGVERNNNISQLEVVVDYINIRKEANTNSEILGKVYYKGIYNIVSKENNWYEIETSDGIKGFIKGKVDGVEYIKELEVNGAVIIEEETDKSNTDDKVDKTTNESVNTTKNDSKDNSNTTKNDNKNNSNTTKNDNKDNSSNTIKNDNNTNKENSNNTSNDNQNVDSNVQVEPTKECGSEGYLFDGRDGDEWYISKEQMLIFFGCDVGEQNTREYFSKNYEDIVWSEEIKSSFDIDEILDECEAYYSLECMAAGGYLEVFDVATGQVVGYASHAVISHVNENPLRSTVYVGQGYHGKNNFYWIEKLY